MKNVKDLYSLRSGIAHSGKVEVSDSELELLWESIRNACYILLNEAPFSKMQEGKELDDWFEARLLGLTA